MEELGVPYRKQIHVVGGGTIEPVREHVALSARAYGTTARQIGELCTEFWPEMDTNVHLTRMADPGSSIETTSDLRALAEDITRDMNTKIVFWSPAVADFRGEICDVPSDLHADRLHSIGEHVMRLVPNDKIVNMFRRDSVGGRRPRKDIFAIGFKTTTGATAAEQYSAGLRLVKKASLNLVLANDTRTRNNMVITPEEAPYHETTDRETALRGLVEMAYLRSRMHYAESKVTPGEPVPWSSSEIFPALRTVVDHCIQRSAYKSFLGTTTGHFSVKTNERQIISSRRKTDFNDIENVGMVRVDVAEDGALTAYGSKPSAGARAQVIVYQEHQDKDCIVHFHCPTRPGSNVSTAEQYGFECGSVECGVNTVNGLQPVGDGEIAAVFLEKHGPNIIFHHSIDPQKVINFIEENFDLSAKTGDYIPVS